MLLGSGLDSPTFRITWPQRITVFEVDTPATAGFKESVLRSETPSARARKVVVVDLRDDWTAALEESGFDRTAPTAWLAEELLGYLAREDARRLVGDLSALSTQRSRLAFEYLPPTTHPTNTAPDLGQRSRAVPGAGRFFSQGSPRGIGVDAESFLHDLGWQPTYREGADVASDYGRILPDERTFGYMTSFKPKHKAG